MTLEQALQIFNLTDISSEDVATLRKKYKRLMIKYQPDSLTGNEDKAKDVIEAFSLLKEIITQMKQIEEIEKRANKVNYNVIIPLSKLIDIYNGEELQMKNSDETFILNKGSIRKHNILIVLEATLEHGGITQNLRCIRPMNLSDEYIINCDITVTELDKPEKIKISLCSIDKNIEIESQSVKYRITLDFNIVVNIVITKKMLQDT